MWQQIITDQDTNLLESDHHRWIQQQTNQNGAFYSCTIEISIEKYARMFFDHVFKLHGLPKVISFTHDPSFLCKFWVKVFANLGTDLVFSTAFHP